MTHVENLKKHDYVVVLASDIMTRCGPFGCSETPAYPISGVPYQIMVIDIPFVVALNRNETQIFDTRLCELKKVSKRYVDGYWRALEALMPSPSPSPGFGYMTFVSSNQSTCPRCGTTLLNPSDPQNPQICPKCGFFRPVEENSRKG